MAWISDFLERLFPVKERYGADASAVVIDIPAELYYKELAIYTASSLIGNAISRSEIKVYRSGKPIKDDDYYTLNISPNRNETASIFWHKVINRVIRKGEALVVEVNGNLFCADSYTRVAERPVLGDVYGNVTLGKFTFQKRFGQEDSYIFRLDNVNGRALIDGMYDQYGKILSTAARALRRANGQKYKLHVDGIKAGDEDFNREFEEFVSKQLKTYMESDNAVYPEFDGYKLEQDQTAIKSAGVAANFVNIKNDLFSTVGRVYHIPDAMMTGGMTNVKDIIQAFLTFGVDPFADMIGEVLNKGAGAAHMARGDFYRVDTSGIIHVDAFDVAADVSNLISSGIKSIDEIREMLGDAPINAEWSKKHFITKNFEEIERFLKNPEKGGE